MTRFADISRPPRTSIAKTLSANDTGETGGHQAGILVPREPEILSFFPSLGTDAKNPRVHLLFEDPSGEAWVFAFIYYNNSYFGGTRNEYRLTRMTKFIRAHNLREGDELILRRDLDETRHVDYRRQRLTNIVSEPGVLRLGSSWKVIPT
jgi:hypothetical protein